MSRDIAFGVAWLVESLLPDDAEITVEPCPEPLDCYQVVIRKCDGDITLNN